jgi:hypothetical protein
MSVPNSSDCLNKRAILERCRKIAFVLSEAVFVIETDAKNCIHEFGHELPFMIAHPYLAPIDNPGAYVDRFGKKEMRFTAELKSVRIAHRVGSFVVSRWRERPRRMVNFAAVQASLSVGTVKAVSGRKPMLECSRFGTKTIAVGLIGGIEPSGRFASMSALALVTQATVLIQPHRHRRVHVRKIERGTGYSDGNSAFRVERKEPHPWFVIGGHVRANVQLQKTTQAGQRRATSRRNFGH